MPFEAQPVAPWVTEHLSNEEASDLMWVFVAILADHRRKEILQMQTGVEDMTGAENYNDLMAAWPMM